MTENFQEQRRQLREKWVMLMQEWQISKLSVTEWCRQRDIPPHRFYYWRRELVVDNDVKIDPGSFIEISDKSISAGIDIVYRDISIRPSKDFDAPTLLKCLQLLRNF